MLFLLVTLDTQNPIICVGSLKTRIRNPLFVNFVIYPQSYMCFFFNNLFIIGLLLILSFERGFRSLGFILYEMNCKAA